MNDVRIILREGEPWWVLADVCAVLVLTEDEAELRKCFDDDEISQTEFTTIISEPGLYTLLFRVPGFSRLVWREIVPSIRTHGCYPPPGTQLASSHDPRQVDVVRKLFAPLGK